MIKRQEWILHLKVFQQYAALDSSKLSIMELMNQDRNLVKDKFYKVEISPENVQYLQMKISKEDEGQIMI
jgi:hypothetical protein